eukprot:snap_masked-scaffold_10-processed-gene-5.23-mRNA-1 protein AED:1.00 eAED:1.00 QI:0/-1/0/0/-1/1/1/0/219
MANNRITDPMKQYGINEKLYDTFYELVQPSFPALDAATEEIYLEEKDSLLKYLQDVQAEITENEKLDDNAVFFHYLCFSPRYSKSLFLNYVDKLKPAFFTFVRFFNTINQMQDVSDREVFLEDMKARYLINGASSASINIEDERVLNTIKQMRGMKYEAMVKAFDHLFVPENMSEELKLNMLEFLQDPEYIVIREKLQEIKFMREEKAKELKTVVSPEV